MYTMAMAKEIFEGNRTVLYISLHRHEHGKFYPGTGAADEVGVMDGQGYTVNIPWSQSGIEIMITYLLFSKIVLPIASEFAPDITIVSAGFDAARGDPLGCCDVTPAGYAQMTHMLSSVSGGKSLVILEEGYNLRSISSSAHQLLRKYRSFFASIVLVHSSGVHGGHYYAYIRQILLDQWFKFDDERVTKEDVKKALVEQYGGEEEIRLKKEQEEKEHKKKEKAKAHLYTSIKVARDDDLAQQIGRDIYFDLVDHDKVYSFRIQNDMPFNLFKDEVAKEFSIPVEFQRFWLWANRQNHTFVLIDLCILKKNCSLLDN
ncbi:hypothetical protein HPP92_013947 [Vanilla planifolia]|uniref:histone deacetylase n=1 Tax=Vanilla planifolia TaxID=51239 RepID=A0A835QU13_VANPL|nr:hypothetical protein HPP92_013947 [Vanilla planifolia]